MTGVRIRTLSAADADQLLQFELAHRNWFEQHIEPRGDAFYSPEGVRGHIAIFLAAHAAGSLHPCVLTDDAGIIIGRANLKDIRQQNRSAEVGYRIGQSHVGRGLATVALRFLIGLAETEWQLATLSAFVRTRNVASARVVEKCGFVPGPESEPDLSHYTLRLPG